ncbi:hypothetical protein L9F63_019790 [Diploptera punctata]|uniref:Uncharacterized protein n=1 Tax=Diploptera punctata TaxID=6984 RepID=A0AAD7ZTJ1_DIPPU|nr:hypothetical protein L9F63_019790 [Diploptera punctata]
MFAGLARFFRQKMSVIEEQNTDDENEDSGANSLPDPPNIVRAKTENTAVQSSLLSNAVSSYVDQDVNEEVVLRKVEPSFSSECNYQNEIHIKSEHDMNKQPENSEKNNEAKIESSISP